MTAALALAVALGAAVGAPLRYMTERLMAHRFGSKLPWGTFTVNIVGSAIVGVVLGLTVSRGLSDWWMTLLAIGFCGSLTTFSGFAAQVLERTVPGDEPRSWRGIGYAAASLLLGVLAAAAAYAVAS